MTHGTDDEAKPLTDGPTLRVRMRRQTQEIPPLQVEVPELWRPAARAPRGDSGTFDRSDAHEDEGDRDR